MMPKTCKNITCYKHKRATKKDMLISLTDSNKFINNSSYFVHNFRTICDLLWEKDCKIIHICMYVLFCSTYFTRSFLEAVVNTNTVS